MYYQEYCYSLVFNFLFYHEIVNFPNGVRRDHSLPDICNCNFPSEASTATNISALFDTSLAIVYTLFANSDLNFIVSLSISLNVVWSTP